MKRLFRMLFTACLLIILTQHISADELTDYSDEIFSALDDIAEQDISADSISDIGLSDVSNYIISIIKPAIKKQIKILCIILSVSIIGSLISSLSDCKPHYSLAVSLACFAGIASYVQSSIEDIAASTESVQAFLVAYIPIYASTIAASGNLTAATSYSAILLYATEGVSAVMSILLKPLIACMLATAVIHSLNSDMPDLSRNFKKLATILIGFLMTIFLGIIGLQSLTGKYTSKITVKAGKYLVSSFVPVIGNTLTESYQTVMSSLDMIRSTVGIFGIIIITMIMLIPIINALFFKLTFQAGELLAMLFFDSNISRLCRSLADVYSMLLYATVLYMMMLIIATGALISLGSINI